jgi:hypothetical protein
VVFLSKHVRYARSTRRLNFISLCRMERSGLMLRFVTLRLEVGLVYNSRLFVARTGRDLQRWLKG